MIFRLSAAAVTALCSALVLTPLQAQTSPATSPARNEASMSRATGPFDVKLTPQEDKIDAALGRMIIDKQFHGELEATSRGQMLSTMTAVKGSAGYVAIEIVSGSLDGRNGTFALQHSATMNRGTPSLSIAVVPDSGTGQLTGLTGKMNINIAPDGKHSYDFEYTLPAAN
ncbi:DUF3224 domain-containing protein [Edaphobacter modestus]|uniref:Uncharacterized protein DUF3224 n=1 Tax=Edaphobacter modestus TaxID=388466 RepID=A0A4Q7YWV8_9BACT|nr:DUF3224 domain-containing protein [Edaphobacter modestus]RZU41884.1 uncharacterized protein DUF3224 [Edaphobacter modestus]